VIFGASTDAVTSLVANAFGGVEATAGITRLGG
jgi:hypothetical protein